MARRSSFPLVWMPWQRQMMTPYLLPVELPETQLTELSELSELAMHFAARQDNDLVRTLLDMNKGGGAETMTVDVRVEEA